jgi:hypothetical protein
MAWHDNEKAILDLTAQIGTLTERGARDNGLSSGEVLKIDILTQKIERLCYLMMAEEIDDRLHDA